MASEGWAVERLRACALFAQARPEVLAEVARALRRRRFRRNEVIFHQGDPGDSLHVVAAGAVKIVLPSTEGDEAIIATLRGDFFGELALLDGAHALGDRDSARADRTMMLRDRSSDLLDRDPGLRDALLALVAELRRLTGHVQELHFLDLAGRLAMRLTRLALAAEPGAHGEVRLDWPYTQSDLAAMIGGTRQSVNKLLSGLVDEDLIRIERDTLVVTDVDKLALRADR
jgi:CRP-like cAMP-binding protein